MVKTEKKSTRKFSNIIIVVIITVIFMMPGASVFTNDNNDIIMSLMGTIGTQWNVTLNFNEDSSGKVDYVVFGEAPDANDGEPPDSYDVPKPPAPQSPYLRAWFDDNLSTPYNKLWEDYRRYPDTEKTWDLYAKWDCYNSNLTNITISWDISDFTGCEYNSIVLTRYDPFNATWDFASDMLTNNNYTYIPRWFNEQWLIDQFQITATAGMQDTTPPVTTCTLDGIKEGDLYVGPVTVTLNSTDDMSGVDYTMYDVDSGGWYQYENPFVVLDYGEHIVCFYSVDNAGNVELEKNCTFTIKTPDMDPPVTICTLDGELVGGVYVSDVTVTLTATDDISGVNYTMYKINDDIWQEYSSPFVVSEDGTYIIYFYSVDNAGNVELEKNCTFTIKTPDMDPPVTICTLDGELVGGVYVSDVTVTLTATDDISGVNYTMYKINDDIWQEYSSPFVVSEDGTYIIYFYSVDNAGNVELEKNIIFIIDLPDVVLKAVFIFGQIRNPSTINNFIIFDAVSVRYFSFSPFDFGVYTSGEQVTVLNKFIGLLTFHFIFGFFKVA